MQSGHGFRAEERKLDRKKRFGHPESSWGGAGGRRERSFYRTLELAHASATLLATGHAQAIQISRGCFGIESCLPNSGSEGGSSAGRALQMASGEVTSLRDSHTKLSFESWPLNNTTLDPWP